MVLTIPGISQKEVEDMFRDLLVNVIPRLKRIESTSIILPTTLIVILTMGVAFVIFNTLQIFHLRKYGSRNKTNNETDEYSMGNNDSSSYKFINRVNTNGENEPML